MHQPGVVYGLQLMRRFATPESQSGAVDINPLPGINLALAIQWQMIGVLREDYAGDRCFCWHAALDQARLCRCLHNARLARPTCVLRAACDDDLALRGTMSSRSLMSSPRM